MIPISVARSIGVVSFWLNCAATGGLAPPAFEAATIFRPLPFSASGGSGDERLSDVSRGGSGRRGVGASPTGAVLRTDRRCPVDESDRVSGLQRDGFVDVARGRVTL